MTNRWRKTFITSSSSSSCVWTALYHKTWIPRLTWPLIRFAWLDFVNVDWGQSPIYSIPLCVTLVWCVNMNMSMACTHILISFFQRRPMQWLGIARSCKLPNKDCWRMTLIRSECPFNREETICSGAPRQQEKVHVPHNLAVGRKMVAHEMQLNPNGGT